MKKIWKIKKFFYGAQKSEPNQQTEPNQTNPDGNNRQLGLYLSVSALCSLLSIFPIFVPIYARLHSRINTKRPLRRYMHPLYPPPILERENLGSLSSIFFLNFFLENFFWNFFAAFHKISCVGGFFLVLVGYLSFCGCGYF